MDHVDRSGSAVTAPLHTPLHNMVIVPVHRYSVVKIQPLEFGWCKYIVYWNSPNENTASFSFSFSTLMYLEAKKRQPVSIDIISLETVLPQFLMRQFLVLLFRY